MSRWIQRKRISGMIGIGLILSLGGCAPTDETVTALVDLAAGTLGTLVQIGVKALIDALLSMGQSAVNLALPISQQFH